MVIIAIVSASALAASNSVPVTGLEDYRATVNLSSIFPQCSSIFSGGKYNLWVGTSGNDTYSGNNGTNNCIIGLGGDDHLTGGNKNNVIDGGPGIDHCFSGVGNNQNTFINCEFINGTPQPTP